MWELERKEGWVLKNWCFWTVVLEKTLESPLDCKEIQPVHPKGNQSWMFIGRSDTEVQYFGHLMRRADSLEKTLMLGKIEGRRRRGWQRMRWLDGITYLMDMSLSRLQEIGKPAVHGLSKGRTWLSNWTTTNFWLCWVFTVTSRLALVAVSRGCSVAVVRGRPIADFSCCGAWALQHVGSVVVVPGLSYPVACEILPDQGSNLCPPHWQADSQPLDHQGSLLWGFKKSSSCMAVV